MLLLPPDALPPPTLPLDSSEEEHPGEVGWWVVGAGPSLAVGYALSPWWTATATVRAHGTWLDTDGVGTRLVTLPSASLGVEAAW